MQLGEGHLSDIDRGIAKRKLPIVFSQVTNLITKLNADNPRLFKATIVWLGGKEPVIGTYRRGRCSLVDMESAATGEIHKRGKILLEESES
ncbi:hypothetical protein V6N13_120697 [Hibiscus sabdariffa]